ncbi:MAG TPA: aldehyde dehydrogenase family protein [Blastocatellia bacterium]|nr:aldehyde dehydrogenase family protein [Blastocatellia bacterium]
MTARLMNAAVRGAEIVSINPATLEELGRFRVASVTDVDAAVAGARAAAREWASLSFRNRARYILKVRRALYDRKEEISRIISDETGKPEFEALTTEVFMVSDLMSHFAMNAERILRDKRFTLAVFRNKRSMICHEPLGVIGVISPWNFPFSIPVGEIVMALMAGNTVVLKPSEFTPLVGDAIKRLFASAGFPEGVFEVVQGDGSTGAALVESSVDKIFFTGSVRTGKKIAESAARRLLPVVLELGGKDPMIVCEDAPFERTVKGAVWGAFMNCGQVCASVERLYVTEPVAEKFIAAVVDEVKKLRVGPPAQDCSTDIGPLTNENQLNIVSDQVTDAIAKGARVLVGGRRREDLGGYFFEPTVLVDVNDSMKVMTEETFGPLLPIKVVKDEDEAIREANNSRYGLLASVWTSDNEKGRRMARRIEAGTVIINDAIYTHGAAQTPWFGVKESGLGVTHGQAGLFEFVRMKHVNWDLFLMKSDWWWFPYTPKWEKRFKTLMKVLYRWGLRKIS